MCTSSQGAKQHSYCHTQAHKHHAPPHSQSLKAPSHKSIQQASTFLASGRAARKRFGECLLLRALASARQTPAHLRHRVGKRTSACSPAPCCTKASPRHQHSTHVHTPLTQTARTVHCVDIQSCLPAVQYRTSPCLTRLPPPQLRTPYSRTLSRHARQPPRCTIHHLTVQRGTPVAWPCRRCSS